ncbi:allantoicase [Tremella mesenterica]|uniref:Allantoicase n=1 Tax=Tremella mesenterica TaxID=5217 RepID=A0A4Q1BLE7_TREME|nr:allantoicase [Tremella mesenterica]
MATSIPVEVFDSTIKFSYTEISSSILGSRIIACSDDFFAPCDNLIKPSPSVSLKGQFGPNGALYDGWESRRHNPAYDWVIIRLPTSSHLHYVDIDTSHFNGNEAPFAAVYALRHEGSTERLSDEDKRWRELLTPTELGPDRRHIFQLGKEGEEEGWNILKVHMIPDGGMARFRAYGRPIPPALYSSIPPLDTPPIDLLSALVSGRIISCSDAKFSPPQNLILPGRGHDMSDGWETRRSQVNRGKKEWVILQMAATGVIRWFEVDTAFHPGNYPKECMIEACLVEGKILPINTSWTTLVRRQPLGPHRQHFFDLERSIPSNAVFSHVRLSTYPDGGLKRLRAYGYPIAPSPPPLLSPKLNVPALPLTVEAFKPYGAVLQGFSLPTSAPKGINVTIGNQGTASKCHRMAIFSEEEVKKGVTVRAVSSLFVSAAEKGAAVNVTHLENRCGSTTAFIPMGSDDLRDSAQVVVVANSKTDGTPDMRSLRAFLATAAQGVAFSPGTWCEYSSGCWWTQLIGRSTIDHCQRCKPRSVVVDSFTVQIPPYSASPSTITSSTPSSSGPAPVPKDDDKTALLHPERMTSTNFARFGHVIHLNPDVSGGGVVPVVSNYPLEAGAKMAISVSRSTPKVGLVRGKIFDVRLMERHPYNSQVFIPMGKAGWEGMGEEALPSGGSFLVIVALNGKDDRPDPKTLSAFIMPPDTGLSYSAGVWHHPVLVMDNPLNLACIETQVSDGRQSDDRDCELLEWTEEVFGRVAVPSL